MSGTDIASDTASDTATNAVLDRTIDAVLDAVGEPNRRRLLRLLRVHHESTVTELVAASGMRQPQVSKHLRVLADASLVVARTDGRFRRYRLDGRGLRAAHDWFAGFEDVWRARFDALDALVSSDAEPDPPSSHTPSPHPEHDQEPTS